MKSPLLDLVTSCKNTLREPGSVSVVGRGRSGIVREDVCGGPPDVRTERLGRASGCRHGRTGSRTVGLVIGKGERGAIERRDRFEEWG